MTDTEPTQEAPPTVGELLTTVEELIAAVEGARSVPLSANVMLDREQFLEMLQRLHDELPDELRASRWMVREREAFVRRTNEKARELLDEAKRTAAEMTSESYIVREAVEEANKLVANAESEGRRIRLEAEDHAESRLAEAETVLGELLQEVRQARGALHAARPPVPEPPVSS